MITIIITFQLTRVLLTLRGLGEKDEYESVKSIKFYYFLRHTLSEKGHAS